MPLRLKLFLGISLFFSLALSFFGYIAYDAAVQSGTARELVLLHDLSTGLVNDMRADIGRNPEESAIKAWLHEFNSLHLSIMVVSGRRAWLSDTARRDLPVEVKRQIMTVEKSGSASVNKEDFVWDTMSIGKKSYTLSVIHRADVKEVKVFFKRLTVPLVIAALIILWVAVWSTQYIAALLEKLNAQKNKLKHQAMHDALTNLPNRALMLDRLQATMKEVDQSDAELALLFIDLNRFKNINDSLGHHYGDMLLVQLAQRLVKVLRRSDMVARMGGDEFAVVLGHVTEGEAGTIADKLNTAIAEVVEVEDKELFVTGSIGIARYPSQASDTNTLLRCADVAMYAAKRAGGGCVPYDESLDTPKSATA